MTDRVQRWTEAQRAQQRANTRDYFAQRRFGYGPGGYQDKPGEGQQMFNLDRLRGQYGAFADPTVQYQERGGVLYQKAQPNQTGRIAAGGGEWQPAPDYVQRGYQRAQSQPFEYGSQRAAANHLSGLQRNGGYVQVAPGVWANPNHLSDAYNGQGTNVGVFGMHKGFTPNDPSAQAAYGSGYAGGNMSGFGGAPLGAPPGAAGVPGAGGVSGVVGQPVGTEQFRIGDQGGLPPAPPGGPFQPPADVTGVMGMASSGLNLGNIQDWKKRQPLMGAPSPVGQPYLGAPQTRI